MNGFHKFTVQFVAFALSLDDRKNNIYCQYFINKMKENIAGLISPCMAEETFLRNPFNIQAIISGGLLVLFDSYKNCTKQDIFIIIS